MFFREIKLVSTRTSNVCYTVNKRIWKSRFFFKTRKKLKKWPEDVDFGSIWNARHRGSISVSVARLSIAEAAPPAEQLLEERNSAPPKRVTLP